MEDRIVSHKIGKEDWRAIILGIRKKLNLSQDELSKELCLSRSAIVRLENRKTSPRISTMKQVSNFIDQKRLDTKELKLRGMACIQGYSKDMKVKKLHLNYSVELAELLGILLGDGEIMPDGTQRISFDPKKDKNFLYRRIFPLIHYLIGNEIYFESYKRIAIYNTAFMRYLKEDCNLSPGSKFENNWEIPQWCFEKEQYLSAVLRGLFDTDGYFGYFNGSLDLMYGRFSDKCDKLVRSMESALKMLNLNPVVSHTKDGRYKLRISNKKEIIGFFSIIGTSNLKHIVRFLLWRIKRYEAKIEIEGLRSLVKMVNELIKFDIRNVKLPFLWHLENKHFTDWITIDQHFLKGLEFRKLFKWNLVSMLLIKKIGAEEVAKQLEINARSVRKWKEGIRTPSALSIHKLMDMAEKNNISLSDYRCD